MKNIKKQGQIVHRSGLKTEEKILLFDSKDFYICKIYILADF